MSSLNVQVALSHPYVPATLYSEEPLYALLEITPVAPVSAAPRPQINLVLVVDSSATMHHFELSPEERDYWIGLAISRDEIERGEADERTAVYWTGQTLAEMQSVARKPMALVVEAIKSLLAGLQTGDRVEVIAFADRVHRVFNAVDWVNVPDQCLVQLDLLREDRLPIDIGTGTRMAEALRLGADSVAQLRDSAPQAINRLLVISDGIVQDEQQSLADIAAIQMDGIAISTIGVGSEFDEEFLMKVADNSRGQYHYAADTIEIADALNREMSSLESTAVTDLYIAVRGIEGAVVRDIFLVRPTMSLFDELETEDTWMRARIGDVSSLEPAALLVQIAPPALSTGSHVIAEAQMTWSAMDAVQAAGHMTTKATISVGFTDDPAMLAQSDRAVQELVDRFSVYKYEREAQWAQERGDIDRAREKLGAATRQLHKIGEEQLAQDMEQQLSSLEDDPTRVKRIKATTRRLGAIPPTSSAE